METSNEFKWGTDSFLNRDYNWDNGIAETCIIGLANNAASIEQAESALSSCKYVGQENARIFHGYDGTDRESIVTPQWLSNREEMLPGYAGDFVRTKQYAYNVMSWIKVLDTALSVTEVACALSHISLWLHCININKPIVILEHDAYMLRPFTSMTYTNSIEYLGHSIELPQLYKQAGVSSYLELIAHYRETGQYPEQTARLPVTMVINYNFLFSHGLHAYAIDPFMARRLFARLLTDGLINPIDVVVEVSEFELVQTGVYATLGAGSLTSTIDRVQHQTGQSGRKNTYSIPGVSQ